MNALTQLNQLGIRTGDSDYIQEKIRLTNAICLFGIFVISLSLFSNAFVYPPSVASVMLVNYISILVACILTLGLNYLRFYNASRIFFSLFVSLSSTLVYITLHPADGPALSLMNTSVILVVIPWLLFDLQEWGKLVFNLSIQILGIIVCCTASHWIEVTTDRAFLYSNGQSIQQALLSCIVVCFCIYTMKKSNSRAKQKNENLIEEMQQQQQVLLEKEAKLSSYITEVEEAQRVNQQRQWTSDGLATFAEILRRESHDTTKLYDILISQIVRYVHANQGGLFLVQNEGSQEAYIELAACYAYERKKYQKKRIEIGEGMVGQAVQEVDALYLTEIPSDYIHITSGLGKANPTCLLIIPLQVNDHVEGVLELASFTEFEPYQVEFLKKLGESIAATIATTRINQRTKELLDASQWQTEALRAQEEEMRQNMEELAATQEEMERKTREMEELYAQSREREKELMNNMVMLENTRKETEAKQQEIQTLLHEAQRNEEQLRSQEEMLRNTLAQIQTAQHELQAKNEEIEKTKQDEKARAVAQIESQKKIMQKVMDKQKAKEQEMQQKLEALQLELEEYRRKIS